MITVVIPASVSQSRAHNVFRFEDLPPDVQDDVIENQTPDYDYWSEMARDTIACDIDGYYPGFLPPGVTFEKKTESYNCGKGTCSRTKNDIEWSTDSYGNGEVTFAADVATCQLLPLLSSHFPISIAVCEDIAISLCHPNRYDPETVVIEYTGEVEEGKELSIAFETELEKLKNHIETEIYANVKGEIENHITETYEYYGSRQYWIDELSEGSGRYFFIDGTEVDPDIANAADQV